MSKPDSATLGETLPFGIEDGQSRIDVCTKAVAMWHHHATNYARARRTGGRDAS